MPFKYWTAAEETILRQHYPTGGTAPCAALMPQRTRGAVAYHAAYVMKLRAPKDLKAIYAQSEAIDNAIRECWANHPEKGAVTAFAARLGRPRWWVSKRARELGYVTPRFKEPDWTEPELQLLADTSHLSLGRAHDRFRAAGFARSENSLLCQRKRHDARPADNGYHTASQIARLLGVDNKYITTRCIAGHLKAERRGTERLEQQGGDHWWIHERDVRAWIIANADATMLRKVPPASVAWFVGLLAGR